ncbi:MAG: hypothetical protein QM749_03965 [Aquabacterium sp.]
MKKKTPSKTKTPIRNALRNDSSLQKVIRDGLGAVEAGHRGYLSEEVKSGIADSLELDQAMKEGREQENRWDYLLGHADSATVIALEPHAAKQDEVSTVIRKRTAAREQLRGHLKDNVHVAKWLWVASGKVQFADTEKARRLLDQNGIEFVGTKVLPKHFPKKN